MDDKWIEVTQISKKARNLTFKRLIRCCDIKAVIEIDGRVFICDEIGKNGRVRLGFEVVEDFATVKSLING